MRTGIDHRDRLIIDRETLARALHRATCDCPEGARSLKDCLLGHDAGWLDESDRLLSLLRQDPNVCAAGPVLAALPGTGATAGAPAA